MAFPGTDLDIIIRAYLGADPTADPSTWPAATDLSSRLLRQPIQIRRGRGKGQKTAAAGGCVFWLDNTDGALTPTLATSVYYPNWDLGVPMDVSVDNVGTAPPYVRFAGFAADIKMVMVPGGGGENISAVQVTLGGVIRRLTQGAVAKSALTRTIIGAGPLAYWPLEDADDATSGASALSTGEPMIVQSGTVDWAGSDPPPGVAAAPDLTADGRLVGPVPPSPLPTFVYTVEFLAKCALAPQDLPIAFRMSGGLYPYFWVVTQVDAAFASIVFGGDGVTTVDNFGTFPLLTTTAYDNEWHHYRLILKETAGSVGATMYLDGVAGTSLAPTVMTLGAIVGVEVNSAFYGASIGITGSVAHVAVYAYEVTEDHSGAMLAYVGEQAPARFERVCAEEGIPYSGTALSGVEMGPQPVTDAMAVLRDCEEVDHGMIVEDFAFGLDYRASSQRFNLDPVMTIDLSTYRTTSGTQADVLTPVRNDARVRNEWTITRPDGSSATVKDEAHQAKRGRYNDSATVNVEDDDATANEAGWRVHEGTFEGLRYETIPLDIAANL